MSRYLKMGMSEAKGGGIQRDRFDLAATMTMLFDKPGPIGGPSSRYSRMREEFDESQPGLTPDYGFSREDLLLPQRPPQPSKPKPKPQRRLLGSWRSSRNMVIFLLFGVACAVGHHIFYSMMDGRAADDQLRMLRYGTMLAFGAKTGLSGAVIQSFQQRVWTTCRTQLLTLGALDSLFSATEDLLAFKNTDFLRNAKVAIALAVFVWLAPLMVVLTSATLLVEPSIVFTDEKCAGIHTLNFSFEETGDWRAPPRINKMAQISLSFWNTTNDGSNPPGWFDYYSGANTLYSQAATVGAFMGGAVPRKGAAEEICGSFNCTFTISFLAPGFKCTQLASGIGARPADLVQESGTIAAPFGTDVLLPEGNKTYWAIASDGDYPKQQLDGLKVGGIPNVSISQLPKDFGVFRTEPIVWIGLSVPVNPWDPTFPQNASDPRWKPSILACEHYEMNYTVLFNFTNGVSNATVVKRKTLAPVVNTTLTSRPTPNGTFTAAPEENYVVPTDVARYRRVAAYHSMGSVARAFIEGTSAINKDSPFLPMINTEAVSTKLFDPVTMLPHADMQQRVQSFYEDIVLSIFSNVRFEAVVWASQPDRQAGTLSADQDPGRYPCTRSRRILVYSYQKNDLWIVYGIATALALSGVAVGRLAVHTNNGVWHDTHFSSIMAATRDSALDGAITWENQNRTVEIPKARKDVRMGYVLLPCDGESTDKALHQDPDAMTFQTVSKGMSQSPAVRKVPARYGFRLEVHGCQA